jgi:transcriptional regulator GlxA family with amidase domain
MARIVIVAPDGGTMLDFAGPVEVFASASLVVAREAYRVEIASSSGGAITTSSGVRVLTRALATVRAQRGDTVLVAGGGEPAIRAALADAALLGWLRHASKVVRRMASVCSGAFLLASAGILDGRRATTHWQGCERLARMFPRVAVEPKAIYVVDGSVWTSAGVTTGIDMALALVEQDLGRSVADAVAAALVLYFRRPGFQSQFSDALVAQGSGSDPLAPAMRWVRANLDRADVDGLARACGLSIRTLHRRCVDQAGTTPAKLIEKLRVEHARTLLSTTALSIKVLADQSGFGSAPQMTRAFEREMGMSPRDYRLLHATS